MVRSLDTSDNAYEPRSLRILVLQQYYIDSADINPKESIDQEDVGYSVTTQP